MKKIMKRFMWAVMFAVYLIAGFVAVKPSFGLEADGMIIHILLVGGMFVAVFLLMLSVALKDLSND